MDSAYQLFDDLLGQEDWLQPNWAGVAIIENDANASSAVSGHRFGAADTNWDLFGSNNCWDTAPWQTVQPLQANNVDWATSLQWAEVSEAGFAHHISMEEISLGSSEAHSHPFSPSVEPTTGQKACDNANESGSPADGAEDGTSSKGQEVVLNVFHKVKYTKETCATCGAPLDTNEQLLNFSEIPHIYCTQSRAAGHLPLICEHTGCGLKFRTFPELISHLYNKSHKSTCCPVPGCEERVGGNGYSHSFSHGPWKYSCAQCGLVFDCKAFLDNHGSDTMHAAYICKFPECGSESTRIADLLRHQLAHKVNVPRHPCPHCRNYRGSNGFKRKDHLRQHIRNYHRIEDAGKNPDSSLFACRDKACEYDYDGALALKTLEQLTDHMIQVHGSSAYVCQDEGCDRVLTNGFETDKHLKLHLKKDHRSPFVCSFSGCDRVGTKGWMRKRDMVKHMKNVHGITE